MTIRRASLALGICASFALASSAVAAPVPPAPPAPPPIAGKNPTADITDEQALGCFYRLIVLSNQASDVALKPGTSEADRKSFNNLEDQASRGVTFSITILYTRPWVADRQTQLAKLVAAQLGEDEKISVDRTEACLSRSLQAQSDVFGAAVPKN